MKLVSVNRSLLAVPISIQVNKLVNNVIQDIFLINLWPVSRRPLQILMEDVNHLKMELASNALLDFTLIMANVL